MIVKKHVTRDGRLLLAVCDSSLKGKKFIEGEKQLDLTSPFYDGKEMAEEEILKLFKFACIINLVGKESVALAVKAGLVDKENVVVIAGIPHAEGMVVSED